MPQRRQKGKRVKVPATVLLNYVSRNLSWARRDVNKGDRWMGRK